MAGNINEIASVIGRISKKDLVVKTDPVLRVGYVIDDKFVDVDDKRIYEDDTIKIELELGIKNHIVKALNKKTKESSTYIIEPDCIISDEYGEAIYSFNKEYNLYNSLKKQRDERFKDIKKKGYKISSEISSFDEMINKIYNDLLDIADRLNERKDDYNKTNMIVIGNKL